MIKYYNINGKVVNASEASLKVGDLAILRGYGAFDFFLVRRGKALFIDDYLARFFNSANLLKLELPVSKSRLKEQVLELIAANGQEEAGIRLLLTGGYADDNYSPVQPNWLILQYPLQVYPQEKYAKGVKMLSFRYQREMPEVKTINYLRGIWLIDRLKQAGATDALYHGGRLVRESARSNFFIISKDGKLVTPAGKILLGITRKNIIRIAGRQLEVEERELPLEEVWTAREAFQTSTLKGVLPVVQLDDHIIGDGKPGRISGELAISLRQFTEEYLESKLKG